MAQGRLGSDTEVLNDVKQPAAVEREATADLIRSLAEVEAEGAPAC